MKKIVLNYYNTPVKKSNFVNNNKYSVFIEFERTAYFDNKKDAVKFLSETSKLLTLHYVKLNNLNNEVLSLFTDIYMTIDILNSIENSIFRYHKFVFESLKKCLRAYRRIDECFFVMNNMYKSIDNLTESCKMLYDMCSNQKKYYLGRKVNLIEIEIELIKKSLDLIGS